MATRRKRKPKVPRNPLSAILVGSWCGVLGFVGLAVLTDNKSWMDGTLLPLVIVLGLVTLAWTIQCWRLGCVALVGHLGQIYHYHRKEEPVGFYFVMMLYVFGCFGLLAYPTQQLLFP